MSQFSNNFRNHAVIVDQLNRHDFNQNTHPLIESPDTTDSSPEAVYRSSTLNYSQKVNKKYSRTHSHNHRSLNVPNSILLLSLHNQQVPVSLNSLRTLFGDYGEILRIVTFQKHNLQALIEFATPQQAASALNALDLTEFNYGGTLFRISFSQLRAPLHVRHGDNRSYDFTTLQAMNKDDQNILNQPLMPLAHQVIGFNPMTSAAPTSMSPTGLIRHSPGVEKLQPSSFQDLRMVPMSPLLSNPPTLMTSVQTPTSNGGFLYAPSGMSVPVDIMPQVMVSPVPTVYFNPLTTSLSGNGEPSIPQTISAVVRADFLSLTVVHDELFILFGVYGDVLRVVLIRDPQSDETQIAFIELVLPEQASLAIYYLNNLFFRGHTMIVTESTKAAIDDAVLTSSESTRCYHNHPAHRFRIPASKNSQHVCAPAQSLHLFNLPENVTSCLFY